MRLKKWVAVLISFVVAIFMFVLVRDNTNTIQLNAILSVGVGFCTYILIRKG